MELAGCSAIVTGGASGLGAAAVRALLAAGVDCDIADVDDERAGALAAELGEGVRAFHADVVDPEQVSAVVAAPRRFPLRILVSCAFAPGGQRLVSRRGQPHDLDLFRRSIEVNLVGTFNAMRLAAAAIATAPPLADGERGVIVNTASISAFEGVEGQLAYAASKSGVVGMTMPAARDLRSHGIRVVTIAPGAFLTPPMERLEPADRDLFTGFVQAPGRLGDPAEFGALVVQVSGNSYVNATTVRLDGGARVGPRPG